MYELVSAILCFKSFLDWSRSTQSPVLKLATTLSNTFSIKIVPKCQQNPSILCSCITKNNSKKPRGRTVYHKHGTEQCPSVVRQLTCNLCFISLPSYWINQQSICTDKNMFPLLRLPTQMHSESETALTFLASLPCSNSTSRVGSPTESAWKLWHSQERIEKLTAIYMQSGCYSFMLVNCKKIAGVEVSKIPSW